MKLLYVDSCVRSSLSRTKRLADCFLNSFIARTTEPYEVLYHNLDSMRLQPIDQAALKQREEICDAHAWNHPLVRPAVEFSQADMVLIAAPYWDLSFPSTLKVWVEHMWVRNLTFYYQNDKPVGLCKGKHTVYMTTSGSPIGDCDFGTDYIKAVMNTLGIPGFTRISAEGLDLDSTDLEAVMEDTMKRTCAEACRIAEVIR